LPRRIDAILAALIVLIASVLTQSFSIILLLISPIPFKLTNPVATSEVINSNISPKPDPRRAPIFKFVILIFLLMRVAFAMVIFLHRVIDVIDDIQDQSRVIGKRIQTALEKKQGNKLVDRPDDLVGWVGPPR
jgi:hypothetical protein